MKAFQSSCHRCQDSSAGRLAAHRAAVSETTAKWRKRLPDAIPEVSEWSVDMERDQY